MLNPDEPISHEESMRQDESERAASAAREAAGERDKKPLPDDCLDFENLPF